MLGMEEAKINKVLSLPWRRIESDGGDRHVSKECMMQGNNLTNEVYEVHNGTCLQTETASLGEGRVRRKGF